MTSLIYDRSVEGGVTSRTFPNELFTVSAQNAPVPLAPFENKPYTYNSAFGVGFDLQPNPGFGVIGVGPQHTFQAIQLATSSTDYRVSGNVCTFFAEATFNRAADLSSETSLLPLFLSPLPPGGVVTTQEEIRLRTIVPLIPQVNLSVTSYKYLTPSIRSHNPPRFNLVEILNSANQSVFPAPSSNLVLGARLLSDSVIALTVTATTTAYPTPGTSQGQYTRGLLVSDLTPVDQIANDVIKIIVQGSYIID